MRPLAWDLSLVLSNLKKCHMSLSELLSSSLWLIKRFLLSPCVVGTLFGHNGLASPSSCEAVLVHWHIQEGDLEELRLLLDMPGSLPGIYHGRGTSCAPASGTGDTGPRSLVALQEKHYYGVCP